MALPQITQGWEGRSLSNRHGKISREMGPFISPLISLDRFFISRHVFKYSRLLDLLCYNCSNLLWSFHHQLWLWMDAETSKHAAWERTWQVLLLALEGSLIPWITSTAACVVITQETSWTFSFTSWKINWVGLYLRLPFLSFQRREESFHFIPDDHLSKYSLCFSTCLLGSVGFLVLFVPWDTPVADTKRSF